MIINIVGILAGILVSSSMIPEIIRCYETKSTRDISVVWLLMNFAGQILWIIYGSYVGAWVLIYMSITIMVLVSFLLYLKMVRFKS